MKKLLALLLVLSSGIMMYAGNCGCNCHCGQKPCSSCSSRPCCGCKEVPAADENQQADKCPAAHPTTKPAVAQPDKK